MLALPGAAGTSSSRDSSIQKSRPGSLPLASLQPRKDLRCYDVLGVGRYAKATEIRHAYRQRSLSFHPDKQHGQMAGFLALAEAFEVLSDASQRNVYDRELGAAKSRDGMAAGAADAPPAVVAPSPQRDCIILLMGLMEIPPDEWPRHISDVPTATIKEMHEHLSDVDGKGGVGSKRPRDEPEGGSGERSEQAAASKPRHLCFGNTRQKGYYCAQIQMCGIHIRTFSTKHVVTVAEAHLALVALKDTFFFKWKENGMTDFDETLRAAAADARSQRMYFPGAMHWFEKMVEPEPGVKWRLTTPCTRHLESTLRNRSEVLQLLNRGANKQALQKSIDGMREAEREAKAAWEETRPSIEHRLYGFLSCELEHRQQGGTCPSKRRRLKGKQSTTQLCVQLPWFGRFAAQHGISTNDLEALLPPLQTRLRGVPSLEQCLQRALRNSLLASGQTALEDISQKAITGDHSAAAIAATNRRAQAELIASVGNACKPIAPALLPGQPQLPPLPQQPQPEQQLQLPPQLMPRLLPQQQQLQQPLQQQQPQQQQQLQQQPPQQPPQQLPQQPQQPPQQPPQPPPQQQKRLAQPQPQKLLQDPVPQPPQKKLHQVPQKLSGQKKVTELQADPPVGGEEADLPEAPAALPPRSPAPRMVTRRSISPGRTVVTRDISPVPRSMPGRSRARKSWRECYSFILQELLADPEVERLFGQPVDLDMYPDYLQKISPNNPVDLRLIVDRLSSEEGGYADVDECSADVSMVWENAARFNAPGSYVRAIAEQAAKIINELLLGRRSMGRIWCRGSSPGQRSSLRPETRSRSETRARSQLSVQFGNESSVPKPLAASDSRLDV